MSYWKCNECEELLMDLVSAQAHALQEGKAFDDIIEKVIE